MKKKDYEKELYRLQIELTHLQEWVKKSGYRMIVVFEGRDAAGKGGVIKAITARVSPRVFKVVALSKPSDRERTQLYMQRYISHFPAAGEIVIFDRSWYNRAGVEVVMGFCTEAQRDRFLQTTPQFERNLVENGIMLVKYWLEVSPQEQEARFLDRIGKPEKNWKLSPIDFASRSKWYDYSRARDRMLDASDTETAPWHIVNNTDKRRGRLNCIAHLLDQVPYQKEAPGSLTLPARSEDTAYDDKASMQNRKYVPERF